MKGVTPYPFFYWYAALIVLSFPLVLLYQTLRLPNFLLSVPFFVAALFFFTVAQVMPCGNHLKYRRFRRWKSIPYSDIRKCREDWIFGYLRTSRYLPPWGGLYFTRQQVGFRWDSDIIDKIQSKTGLK
ncbi:MAG: hypothetical protein AUH11_01415 [Acidobacteria bacterium 13_2_20CM_57_17]|nr:MAG: hypothetical protein AUH11_01415 [Acidobacteria bacterium 13_2_20CM_57_17]OLB91650.1 MAG: hypothetical protein AUI02_09340 [Acidobacteria bacterium 13_2_20CM_2_57_12]